MKVRLPYGKEWVEVDLPEEGKVTVIEPQYVAGLPDQAEGVRDALSQPIGSPPLRELVKSSDSVGILFSDITRPTPYHVILPSLLDQLRHLSQEQIIFFNATGTHRGNTEAELREILGDGVIGKYRIVQNDARKQSSHVHVGTTTSGNDILIHRELVECDLRILTGFIEPHLFAGFSGGGKAIIPGMALLETIQRNHSPKNIDNPRARWGVTDGNPVWEEIQEASAMVNTTFLLNIALNREKQITAIFAGNLEEAYSKGCAFVKETAMATVAEPSDIVITSNSGYPLDLNVYQAVKGMSAAAQVVKDGGSIIIAAECWDGIPNHGAYGGLLREAESPKSLLERIRAPGFAMQDMWQAQIHALIRLRADLYLHTHNLSDEEIERVLLKPCHQIEETVEALLKRYGPTATICVLPQGPQTIPYLKSR
ncbi:MAG: nickel-dependent lactate racemase [Proteobacteria bacterium]|nr:nickel-dependent lactate racemase [Pseudomonadota bacterium]